MRFSLFFKNLSIKTKILAAIIGVTFVSTGATSIIAGRTTHKEIDAQLGRHVGSTYQNAKLFLSLTARHVDQLSMSLLSNEDIQQAIRSIDRGEDTANDIGLTAKQIEHEFLEMMLGRDEIQAVCLLNNEGGAFSTVVDPKVRLDLIGEKDLERIKAAGGNPVWLKTDAVSRTIPMGRLFVDTLSQKPLGILLVFFKEQYFADLFRGLQGLRDSQLFLLSNNGDVISHSNKKLLGKRLHADYVNRLLSNPEDQSFTATINGEQSLVRAFSMPDYNWRLVSVIPAALSQKKADELRNKLLIVGLACWVVAAVIGIVVSRQISKPISRLQASIQEFSIGQPMQKVDWDSTDEMGRVVEAYNRMMADLIKMESDLIQSEKEFRSIFQNAKEGLFRCDSTGKIRKANPAMAEILGFPDVDAVQAGDRTLQEMLGNPEDNPPSDLPGWIDRVGAQSGCELAITDQTGEKVYVTLNMVKAREEDGESLFYNGIMQDITRLKKDETEMASLQFQFQQSQKMESIGSLAGGIAHDFNNILYPIIGMSELLIEDLPEDSTEYDYVKEILIAGKRGGDLVRQILAFSRQSERKRIPLRIQKILKEVMKLAKATIPSYIELEQNIQQDCPMVLADPTQIHQVAMNLITNAYHATDNKCGKITVELDHIILNPGELPYSCLSPGQYALLTVKDTGHGIPAELMDKIFDPYFTTKGPGKGTGLGLATVYGIVKEHKGDITVYSEVGKGTTFNIYFPILKTPKVALEETEMEKLPEGSERILLVDDEPSVLKLNKILLERLGHVVTTRLNSAKAFELFKTKPEFFDIVISDMTMPNMTGDQLAQKIKAIRPDIPIILFTGYSDRIDKAELERIGIDGLLMKPVVKSEMAKMIWKLLDGA